MCQKYTGEALQCPERNTRQTVGCGNYKSLATNLSEFRILGCLPLDIDLERLDNGSGIEATFETNLAAWHKTCFSNMKCYEKKTVKDAPCLSTVKDIPCPSTLRTRNTCDTKSVDPTCVFCEEPAGHTCLHEASTFDIDSRVRNCAHELQDTELLAKLAPGDMRASEPKYHAKCIVCLYNKVSRVDTRSDSDDADDHLQGIAFAQLVSYMEEFRKEEYTAPVFELAGLVDLYTTIIKQLGVSVDNRIHSTRLKMRLLASFPDLTAHTDGRDILLTFDQHLGGALSKACDGEALYLARAAQIVRQEIFDRKLSFN